MKKDKTVSLDELRARVEYAVADALHEQAGEVVHARRELVQSFDLRRELEARLELAETKLRALEQPQNRPVQEPGPEEIAEPGPRTFAHETEPVSDSVTDLTERNWQLRRERRKLAEVLNDLLRDRPGARAEAESLVAEYFVA